MTAILISTAGERITVDRQDVAYVTGHGPLGSTLVNKAGKAFLLPLTIGQVFRILNP